MTTREACGTHFGVRLHEVNAEPICGHCAHMAKVRDLTAERNQHLPEPEPEVERLLDEVIAVLANAMGCHINHNRKASA